tara:strand:- start:56 stop:4945 length:4890 start_codon:yes stop_codon:yes gene_type:complete
MATLVEEIQAEDSPVLTQKEAEEKGVIDYIDKDTGLLAIGVRRKQVEDEEKEVVDPSFVDDAASTVSVPLEKDVPPVKTVESEKQSDDKKNFKVEDVKKFIRREQPSVKKAGILEGAVPSLKGIVKEEGVKAGLPEGTELAKTAEEDIIEQRKPSGNFQDFLNQIENDDPIPELSDKALQRLKRAYQLSNDPRFQNQKAKYDTILNNAFAAVQNIKKKIGPEIAFVRGQAPATTADDNDILLKDKQQRYAEGRIEIAKVITGTFKKLNDKYPDLQMSRKDEVRVEQAIIDRISTGNFFDTFTETISETQRGIMFDMPKYLGEAAIAGRIAKNMFDNGLDFTDAWEASKDLRDDWKKAHLETFKYVGGELLSDQVNTMIIEELENQIDKPGGITRERFNELTQITDADGNVIGQREFVDRTQAEELLFASINQLGGSKRFFMIYLENILGMSSLAKLSGVTGKLALKKLEGKIEKLRPTKLTKDRYKGLSLKQKADRIRLEGEKFDLNTKFQEVGFGQRKVSETLQRLRTQKEKLIDDRAKTVKGSLEYKKLTNEINTIRGKLFRNYTYTLGAYPIFKEGLAISAPASITQFLAAEYLTSGDDPLLDYYSAQGLGAIAYALGGRYVTKVGVNVVTNIGSLVTGKAPTLHNTMSSILSLGSIIPGVPKQLFLDGNIVKFEEFLKSKGQRLNRKQRRAIEYVFKLAENMSDENMELVLDSITNYANLEKSIIKSFKGDPAMQREVEESLRTPFASLTSLGWLRGLAETSKTNVDLADIASLKNVDGMTESMLEQEKMIMLGNRAVENLKSKLAAKGIDFKTNEQVEKIVRGIETALQKAQTELIKDQTKASVLVEDALSTILKDPEATDFTSKEFESLINAGVKLGMKLEPDLKRGEVIERLMNKVHKSLIQRANTMKENRLDVNYKKKVDVLTEDLMESILLRSYSNAKIGYKEFDKAMEAEGKTVNVLPLLKSLIQKRSELETVKTPLSKYFTAEGKFLEGPLAKTLRGSLKEMGVRTLRSKFSESTINKLITLHRQPTIIDPVTKKEVINTKFISENADELDIAMFYSESGDDTFDAFLALPSEVMDVQAAFKNYAFRTNNVELSREVRAFESEIDDLITNAAGELRDMQQNAKDIYRSNIFDRLRDGKGPLSVYNKSKSDVIPLKTTKGQKRDIDTRATFTKETPSQLFSPFIQKINRYVKDPDNELLIQDIIADSKRIFTQLSDRKNFQEVFDMDNPSSADAFNVTKEIINETVYTNWADKIVKSIETVSPRGKIILDQRGGGYDFDKLDIEKLNELSALTNVTVIRNGIEGQEPLIDFAKMISDEKDIVKQMKRHTILQDAYGKFKNKIEARLKAVNRGEQQLKALENNYRAKLREFGKYKSPKQFFEKYVEQGDLTGILELKSDLLALGAKDLKKYEKDIDNVITKLVLEGLLQKGDRSIAKNKFLSKIEGGKSVVYEYKNPEEIVAAIENPNTRKILNEVMSQDHIRDLKNIMKYLKDASPDVEKASIFTVEGRRRVKFSITEILSRVYNLARGMVSPAYVGSEFAVRVALNASQDMVKMAAGDPDAARVLSDILLYPENMNRVKLDEFDILITDFLVTELARLNITTIQEYVGLKGEEDEAVQ